MTATTMTLGARARARLDALPEPEDLSRLTPAERSELEQLGARAGTSADGGLDLDRLDRADLRRLVELLAKARGDARRLAALDAERAYAMMLERTYPEAWALTHDPEAEDRAERERLAFHARLDADRAARLAR
jgi:hypothetical protein